MRNHVFRRLAVLLALASTVMAGHSAATAQENQQRPRLIVLTDIGNEPDDSEAMVRLLLYTTNIEIEGLVATTSRHHPSDKRLELISRRIDAYSQVLAARSSAYPAEISARRQPVRFGRSAHRTRTNKQTFGCSELRQP